MHKASVYGRVLIVCGSKKGGKIRLVNTKNFVEGDHKTPITAMS